MPRDANTRRQILKSAGLAGATAIAGCLGGDGDGGDGDGDGDGNGDTDYSGETLNVLTWAGYEGAATLTEERTGASVNIKLISSDVDGFNTLQGGGTSQFDVLVLDNDWAVRNAQADNIQPVEAEDYPNRDSWIEDFSWPYETFQHEDDMWAVPPRWGWGGIGYDDREIDKSTIEDEGYAIAWNPDYRGELTMADWPTWVIPVVIAQLFHEDLGDQNPMQVELDDDQLSELEDTLVQIMENAASIHTGAGGIRQDMLQGNATMSLGVGNFGLSQLRAEGHDWMKLSAPEPAGGWYWVEGICLVNNPDLKRGLANEFINACLSVDGQYSICWEDASSKGQPVNTESFDEFSESEQRKIMMLEDDTFDAFPDLLDRLDQYLVSPQQDAWLDMWERAKAKAD